jgi:tetratricopeptide (TPR) repeat protein
MGLRRDDQALKSLDGCLAIEPEHALALLARAQISNRQGDAEAALQDVNRVVQKLDTSKLDAVTKAYYLNDRVDLYRQLGRLEDSENDARRSIALDPKQVDAYIALALIEKKRGKPDAARGWYDRMLSANPESSAVHLRRAEFFRDLGRWEEALAEADEAARLDADRGPVLAGLLKTGVQAARGEPDPAVESAEKLLKSAPAVDGQVLYAAACVWSLASGSFASSGDLSKATAMGERASVLLSEALSLGFHDLSYQEKNRMAEDPALAPIRERADVKRLVSRQP